MGNVIVNTNSGTHSGPVGNAPIKPRQWSSNVTTSNGTYSVGMTKKQAEEADSYKALWGLDFADIDKNGDDVLSQLEILEARVEVAKRDGYVERVKTAFGITTGGVLAVGGSAAIPFTEGFSFPVALAGYTLFGYNVKKASNISEICGFRAAQQELLEYKCFGGNSDGIFKVRTGSKKGGVTTSKNTPVITRQAGTI